LANSLFRVMWHRYIIERLCIQIYLKESHEIYWKILNNLFAKLRTYINISLKIV